MPRIYDNIEHNLTKGLNDTLEVSQRADFCVGYFNLRGWKEVAQQVENLAGAAITEENTQVHRVCRLLVGMQKMPVDSIKETFFRKDAYMIDNAEVLKLKKRMAQEFRQQLIIGIPTETDEKALQKLSQQLKDKKVVVKLHLRYTLHAKLYLAYSNDKRIPVMGFLGSSNLTLAGLANQGELNIDVVEQDAANKLANWFDDRWKDKWCLDITNELIEIIDNSWAADKVKNPYHIYLKIAYHLATEARAGISEFTLPKIFQKELLDFQQKAVLVAAHHLNKRDGVVIGDVVGLGKTITATALAKMFEEDYSLETLVLCPKNLTEMWQSYVDKYGLKAKVISQSKAQKLLPNLRRYRMVIIDESHNLRNDDGKRYKVIKEYLEQNDSKVILLSATPYNKSYLDLANQLRLFIDDEKDLGISPERYIESLGGQAYFNSKHPDVNVRSIKAFQQSNFADDWRELMRLYLVRRTRSFIKKNYATTDIGNLPHPISSPRRGGDMATSSMSKTPLPDGEGAGGGAENKGRQFLTFSDGSKSYFPDRIAKRVLYEFNPDDENDIYAKLYSPTIVDKINELQLPRYGLQNYLTDKLTIKATKDDEVFIKTLSFAGKRLMGFCRTNLFKRLESSGYSFLLSLGRHILRNYVFVYAMKNNLPIPIGKNIAENLDDYLADDDLENEDAANNLLKLILKEEVFLQNAEKLYKLFESESYVKKFTWIRSEFFADFTKKITNKDKKETIIKISFLTDLLNDSKKIIEILKIGAAWKPEKDKQLNALHDLLTKTHSKEKILIFTQFADTAYYLAEELKQRGVEKLQCVTGDNENPTEFAHKFSPISNGKPEIANTREELRILVTTDVLSEGQNLQDSHIILNYDLPWAIIRLIQRAGRVDRIGQKAKEIICYSFLPEDGIEDIINLRKRLSQRIKENAEVVGSDETFFDGDPINLMDLYNETSGILDEDNDTEVDLSSMAYEIWKKAIEQNPELSKIIPNLSNVSYASKQNVEGKNRNGVIVYTRTSEDNDVLAWINNKGQVITQSQYTILKAAECQPNEKPLPKSENHHDLVALGMLHISEEEKTIGGALGKKTGVKYRTYTKLKEYCEKFANTLFVNNELEKAVDDILKYPLKEFARETINRQLKAGITDAQLANLVISLREENKLVIINTEEETDTKNPQIICSMGLI